MRFISNAASGRMGFAIAQEASRRGHDVTLVTGPVDLDVPSGVVAVSVVSAQDMLQACEAHFDACDAALMTAAVSDWRPAVRLAHKAAKTDLARLDLVVNPDICATLAAGKGDRVVVGFAVQDESPRELAENKMARKHCDAMVLNGPCAIGAESSHIEIKVGNRPWTGPFHGEKEQHAKRIVSITEQLVGERHADPAANG